MRILMGLMLMATLGVAQDKDPEALVVAMVEKIGGLDGLHALKDVEYRYTYQNQQGADVSIERYVFDGEYSWAEYVQQEAVLKPMEGKVVQGYDGSSPWMTIAGRLVEEPQQLKMADFLRKTNYYWFAMMFKLTDPGLTYAHEGVRKVEGIPYDLVRVGFEQGVGDVQDTYLLYINPYTGLVDQFLFTVMDFGRKDPLLMKVDYTWEQGLILPSCRRYIPCNWDGEPQGEDWTLEIMSEYKFNNGFEKSDFAAPSK